MFVLSSMPACLPWWSQEPSFLQQPMSACRPQEPPAQREETIVRVAKPAANTATSARTNKSLFLMSLLRYFFPQEFLQHVSASGCAPIPWGHIFLQQLSAAVGVKEVSTPAMKTKAKSPAHASFLKVRFIVPRNIQVIRFLDLAGSMTYLDHNATTPLLPEAAEALTRAMREAWANPSSLHAPGRQAKQAVEVAREQVAALLQASPPEILFTSGGTEACNFGILGAARSLRAGHIVASAIEHSAVKAPLLALESEGWKVTWIRPDADGVVAAEAVEAALRPDTVLGVVMAANNEVGSVQPYAEIGALLRARNVLYFCDMTQALGKIPIDLATANVDLASFAAHKIGAPKGVGALYVRKGLSPKPDGLVRGGGQERGLRGGTENVPGIAGFGAAAAWWGPRHAIAERERLRALRDFLQAALREGIPEMIVNGPQGFRERLPNTLHVSFPGARSDTMVMALDLRGIAVSAGSACASGSVKPSEVLLAMGRSPEEAASGLRFSVGFGNTAAEMPAVAAAVAAAYHSARGAARS
jgi:cysteine desulfurase